jgi:YD repeat-containing protein
MLASADVTTPSGLHMAVTHTRFVNKSSLDPLSMTSSEDTTTINGRSWKTQWDAATRVFASTSPKGRTASVTIDSRGMPLSSRQSTFTPVTFTYGTAGRLTRVQQSTRSLSTTYDGRGRVASVTDVLNRTFTYTYDDADRVLTQQTPDGRLLAFTYDAGGNITLSTLRRPFRTVASRRTRGRWTISFTWSPVRTDRRSRLDTTQPGAPRTSTRPMTL